MWIANLFIMAIILYFQLKKEPEEVTIGDLFYLLGLSCFPVLGIILLFYGFKETPWVMKFISYPIIKNNRTKADTDQGDS